MQLLTELVDSSFKYILLGFNVLTLIFVFIHKKKMKITKQHHILFVFAHPDDEAMFFGPTISSLASQYYIHFLCLSSGNTVRATELQQSAQYFGVHKHVCIHNEKMIDGMKSKWCEQTIRDTVKQYVEENSIKAIFTFDQQGISGHLNHRTIYKALSELEVPDNSPTEGEKKKIAEDGKKNQNQSQEEKPLKAEEERKVQEEKKEEQFAIKIYYLETTNLIRKYSGILELLLVPFKEFSWVRFNYFHGYNSMALHQSQWVWFRKLFVLFSRYTYVNTFRMKKLGFK